MSVERSTRDVNVDVTKGLTYTPISDVVPGIANVVGVVIECQNTKETKTRERDCIARGVTE